MKGGLGKGSDFSSCLTIAHQRVGLSPNSHKNAFSKHTHFDKTTAIANCDYARGVGLTIGPSAGSYVWNSTNSDVIVSCGVAALLFVASLPFYLMLEEPKKSSLRRLIVYLRLFPSSLALTRCVIAHFMLYKRLACLRTSRNLKGRPHDEH